MTNEDPGAWEEALIADLREHDGRPSQGPLAGHPIMVMYSTGAKSGQRRRALLTYSQDAGDFIVAGSAGGSPKDPAWLSNVRSKPNVTVELGKRTVEATATVVDEDEQKRLWDAHVAALPWFADYPEKAGRIIPIVRITPKV